MTKAPKSRGANSVLDTVWPYAAFLLLVALYSLLTLAHGFNATDEGYLLSIGARIAEGEAPYTDFYFFRTPLSIYIQAALISVLGDSYTVLVSRWVWTLQMCLVAVLISLLYRRFVRPWELLLLLVTTFTVSSLLLIFPWYSYDALLFAVLMAVFVHFRQYELSGVAAFLAFMCKQNYGILIPGFLVAALIIQRIWPQLRVLTLKQGIRMLIGAVVPLGAYLIYLYFNDTLGAFWDNVFVYPRMASQVSVWFVLFQNHHEVIYLGLPAMMAAVFGFYLRPGRTVIVAVAALATLVSLVLIFKIHHNYIYSLVYVNLALSFAIVVRLIKSKQARESDVGARLLPALIIGVIIQYAAGFNYTGVVLSYMGSGLLLGILYVMYRELSQARRRRYIALGLVVVLLAGGLYHKYTYVYRDVARGEKTSEFRTAKLAGIRSGQRNVRQIESLIEAIDQRSERADYIFMFPDMPIMYYLADRRNPTPVGWYVQLEYGNWLMDEILASLEANRPKVVFAQRYFEVDFERAGALVDYRGIPRYIPIANFINANYNPQGMVGDVFMFLPKE
ncbi:MAG: hypothetical protein JSV52_01200 [Candidatus Zixiibacteriota bacterium]|nr:MAG: hypothetical protein JSV52_01200 [candidate division Zixibacteria bacterium]